MSDDLRTTGSLSVAILVSRVLGLVREVVFAALFGARAVADAYQAAFTIPNLLRDLLAEGALSSAFVPTFTAAIRKDGLHSAYALGNLVWSAVLLLTGGLTGLGLLFAEEVVVAISSGFAGDANKVALAAYLTRWMMPILCLVSLGAVWMGMLNAQRRFLAPAMAPAVFNLVSIAGAGAVWLVGGPPIKGIVVWSVATLVAGIVQAGMQLAALWRLGYRPRWSMTGLSVHPGVRRIARLMGAAVLGVAAVQVAIFVNTRFAGDLPHGALSQLRYAFRLFFLPLGMFGVALATVTTTSVSEAATDEDRSELARTVAEATSAGLMLTSASAVGLWILAEPIVDLVYRHGETSHGDAVAIAAVLRAYVLGLIPYSLLKIMAPAFFSVDRPRIPLFASILGVGVNVAFNALTYREFGAPGIATGTALGATVNALVLRLALSRVIGPVPVPRRATRWLSLLTANVVMGGAVGGGWWMWQACEAWAGMSTAVMMEVIGLTLMTSMGFAVFTGLLRVFGYPGADRLWRLPWALVRRRRSTRAKG